MSVTSILASPTSNQPTSKDACKNQQSKVNDPPSVLPTRVTVMANSSTACHRGGGSVQGVQTDISVVGEGSRG